MRAGHTQPVNEPNANGSTDDRVRTVQVRLTLVGRAEIPVTADSVCHVAGFPIRIADEIRQQCAWCGEIVMFRVPDVRERSRIEYPSEGGADMWQVGSLVRRHSGGAGPVGLVWQGETPPDACYIRHVERP
jgi:hypothetical protein